MITPAQAAAYLDQALGIALPSFLVAAACDRVEAAEPAMLAAGYTEADTTLMQYMAVALVASAGGAGRLQSQSAPSGTSRSFKRADDALSQIRRTLTSMDTAGTLATTVGPDPAAATLMMVV